MNIPLTRMLPTILLFAAVTRMAPADDSERPEVRKLIFVKQQLEIIAETADNQQQREHGLMFRTRLDENRGMLFLYPDQALRYVWMKNTLIPLDVLFLSNDGRIVSMQNSLQPCKSEPCPIYDSEVPAMYMLEMNSGFIKRHGLEVGQELSIH